MTKKIAVICNYKLLDSRVGGMDHFFWAFQKACVDEQISVDWFFPNYGKHGKYKEFNIIPQSAASMEATFIQHLETQHVNYNYVITHFLELCTSFFFEVKCLQKTQIIAVDHNPRPLEGYPLKKRIKKWIKGVLYSKYIDKFIGVSDYTSQAILKDFGWFLKPKVQTIYNGVLTEAILPKASPRALLRPKFLVVSHLRYSKGIQDLIKAVAVLSPEVRGYLCIDIYGDGPFKQDLLKLALDLHVETHFNFKGNKSDTKSIYRHYDYLLQPTYMECFSLSILESLAANVPVITTPVGGNVEVVSHRNNGFIFEAENVEELALLLERVIKGRMFITDNTRPFVETTFSIDRMVAKYMVLLQNNLEYAIKD